MLVVLLLTGIELNPGRVNRQRQWTKCQLSVEAVNTRSAANQAAELHATIMAV